uniref:Uncharacterized protein n=1 Tax=Zymomonas mobilis TaxID=542 RepID=Q9RNY6_ZYMMB|nr:unknown [Zymomonas mobilis subsp. mobilis ZM4 = ATCC 31821]
MPHAGRVYCGFPISNKGKTTEIGNTGSDAFMFQTASNIRFVAMFGNDSVAGIIQQGNPALDEEIIIFVFASGAFQRSFDTATGPMPHNQNIAYFQLGYGIFKCCRYTMMPQFSFIRRHQGTHDTNNKNFTRIGIEYLGRINATIRTGDNQNLRVLTF